jgi:plasmid stabilization system protein ParE
MYNVVILFPAKHDIREAALWYNLQKKELGKKFALKVRQKLNLIRKSPYSYTTRYDEVKTAVLDVFPFMVHYTVDEHEKIVTVYAVLHTSRNPNISNKRG